MVPTYCDIKVPTKGDKLHMAGGRIIFVRSVKGLNKYYDTRTKILLCGSVPEKFEYAMSMIARRVKEIEVYDERKEDSLFG